MAETPDQTTLDAAAAGETAHPSGGGSLVALLKVAMFVTAVVVVECLLAWFYLPSPAETAAWAGSGTAASEPLATAAEPEEEPIETPADQVEVDLEEFSVTAFQPISNTSLRIDFHLYGIVAAEDEAEFLARLDENRHRFREQVLVIARSADLADLTDAGLGLIKRQILDKTNATLGKPLLRAVIFSDFSFVEQ